jgi:hypothetical protein
VFALFTKRSQKSEEVEELTLTEHRITLNRGKDRLDFPLDIIKKMKK